MHLSEWEVNSRRKTRKAYTHHLKEKKYNFVEELWMLKSRNIFEANNTPPFSLFFGNIGYSCVFITVNVFFLEAASNQLLIYMAVMSAAPVRPHQKVTKTSQVLLPARRKHFVLWWEGIGTKRYQINRFVVRLPASNLQPVSHAQLSFWVMHQAGKQKGVWFGLELTGTSPNYCCGIAIEKKKIIIVSFHIKISIHTEMKLSMFRKTQK